MKIRLDDLEIDTGPGSRQQALALASECYREREKTRRFLLAAGCAFFVVAALILVFAPPDKAILAYVSGAVLVILALGSIGVAQFRLKLPGIYLDTHQNGDEKTRRPV